MLLDKYLILFLYKKLNVAADAIFITRQHSYRALAWEKMVPRLRLFDDRMPILKYGFKFLITQSDGA